MNKNTAVNILYTTSKLMNNNVSDAMYEGISSIKIQNEIESILYDMLYKSSCDEISGNDDMDWHKGYDCAIKEILNKIKSRIA